jgi:predicted dehydrogenase
MSNQNSKAFTRRGILKTAGAIAAGASLPKWFVERTLAADEAQSPRSANDKPNVALIGCGGQGTGDARNASRFGNIVAVCDVDASHARQASQKFNGVKIYNDFRKLLDRDDIPIIINGTPDHWHTLVNIHAVRRGKDIYSEKPLTLTIDEGKHVVDEVRRHKRVLQTGSQQRSDHRFRLACELVRNGRVGKLQEITVILPAGPRRGPFKTEPVPKGFDWNFWQGQAPETEYVPERTHLYFRYWYDYSGGTMTDWGAHHNDIALWGMGLDHSGPVEIDGKPLVQMIPGGFTAFSDYRVTYTYANGVRHHCITTQDDQWNGASTPGRTGPDSLHNGVKFIGSDGWIFVDRGKIEASKPDILHEELPEGAVRLYVSKDHMGNFFECVRTRKDPICDVEIGHRSASVCHLGVISMRLGRPLKWDPDKQAMVGDEEAQKWMTRSMRAPWSYEAV